MELNADFSLLCGEIELDEACTEAGAKGDEAAQQPAMCRPSASWCVAAESVFVLLRLSRLPRC